MAGNDGVQLPGKEYRDGKLVGTPRLYTDGQFSTTDGRAKFQGSPWNGWLGRVAQQREKYPFWVNNGRTNHIWQSAYHDEYIVYRNRRFPMAPLEIAPEDASRLGVENGDVVEVYNEYGPFRAAQSDQPVHQLAGHFAGSHALAVGA